MKYRADLDGMRGVAVLLVVLTHAHFPVTNDGGTTGVTAFFVLSGYLITRLLVAEREAAGRIDLRAFYLRRALRLGPALLLLIAFAAFVGVWTGWPGDWRLGIVASLLYVGNWVQVAGYSIDPLGHTWTLAIEEQFYLLWPIVLILSGPRLALRLAIVGVVLGAVAQTVATGNLEYFSTITRGDAILAGCVLGIVQPRVPKALGVTGLVLLVAVSYLNFSHDLATPASIVLSGLVVSSSIPELAVLAPVGRRAYGIYLWNWPMAILFGPIGAVWTFVVAALSFRLVERPLSRRFGPSLHRTATARESEPAVLAPAAVHAAGPLPEQGGP
jgi:peptidoglycan/LPS O-acetylase OafA/YrhL